MSEPTPAEQRKRWINIGEIVAVAGLVISGLALWNSWGKGDDKPVVVKEEKAIPLVLRGKVEDDGKAIRITAVEDSHALEDVTITAEPPGSGSAPFGSEPVLSAAGIEDWLPDDAAKEGVGRLSVVITARYVEHGATRQARGKYRVRYDWSDGGLLSGKSLRLTGFSRG